MEYRSQWLPSSQISLQSLQDQLSRLSLLSSDPSSAFPNLPRPSSSAPTLTPNPILDHHHLLQREQHLLNHIRSLSAAQVHETQHFFPNSSPTLGSGSGSGFAPPTSYRPPTNTDHRLNDFNDHYAAELLFRSYNRNLILSNYMINNNGYGLYNNGSVNDLRCRHRRTTMNGVRIHNDKQLMVSTLLSSCDQMRGRVVDIVTDKDSSHLLLKKFEKGHMEGLKMVVAEIKDNIVKVLSDFDGSHFFQKFLKLLDFQDVHELFKAIVANLHICFDHHGTRAAQEIVKHVDKNNMEVKSIIVQAIKKVFSEINQSQFQNGYHFMDAVLKAFHGIPEVIKPLMSEVAKFSVEISMDKVGCCKLQDIIRWGEEPERSRIIDAIITHAFELSVHDYGNFVIQCAATLKGEQHLTAQVIKRLEGFFVDLSKNKCGSHVVQKCLTYAEPEFAQLVMNEICRTSVFLDLCQHPFGNFVVQTALEVAEMMRITSRSSMYQLMVRQIQDNYALLHSHMYGKRVLLKLNKLQKPYGF